MADPTSEGQDPAIPGLSLRDLASLVALHALVAKHGDFMPLADQKSAVRMAWQLADLCVAGRDGKDLDELTRAWWRGEVDDGR